MLALHGEGSYVPCQDYKNYYTPIWHYCSPELKERDKKHFQDAALTVEQRPVKPTNPGWKPDHQQRRQSQSEKSVSWNCEIWELSQNHHSV